MNYSIVNLGCKVNRVESDGYEGLLRRWGWQKTPAQSSDVIVVNTCTVTATADKKTRKAVRQALRANGTAKVFVTGCAAALAPDTFQAMDSRVTVVPKVAMADALEQWLKDFSDEPLDSALIHVPEPSVMERARRGVKIQDGCNHACTYCIVHVARGRSQSRPVAAVHNDVGLLTAAGIREVMITGVNIGSYNSDGVDLAALLSGLLDDPSTAQTPEGLPVRFRLSSIEPMDIDDQLIALVAASEGRVCRHFHIPLQSGSSRILRAMARPYDADTFEQLVDQIRSQIPTVALSTDIIAGFPGETDEDFQDTCALAARCGFCRIHGFPYSIRQSTPAATMDHQVPEAVKHQRVQELANLATALARDDFSRRIGTEEAVLVEKPGIGRTESYYEVPVDKDLEPGSLVPLVLANRFPQV